MWSHLANELEQAYLYAVQWATFISALPKGGS